MRYMGSKARFANDFLPIVLKDRKSNQYYVEPFAGGMNVIDKVNGNRIANDINKYLIAMWKGLVLHFERPKRVLSIGRDYYNKVRSCYNENCDEFDDFTKGWVGFMASANGRFFDGGYSGVVITKNNTVRDYISESVKNISKQIDAMRGVNFTSVDYRELIIPDNSIIYCDKPYENTKQYTNSLDFDHETFWNWARQMVLKGHKVFISERFAPEDFECVWEKEVKSSLSANNLGGGNKSSIEKLFVYKN